LEYIAKNLAEIRSRIAAAAAKSGRKAEDITLVAVTKTVDAERIKEAIRLGVTDLRENRVQEMVQKDGVNGEIPIKWHMIGHLQRNKVRDVLERADLIHSLDSVRLAEEIQKNAEKMGIIADVLIEINIAHESSKFGVEPKDAVDFANELEKFGNIRLRGLMCVAPFVGNAEENREYFRQMRKIFIDIREKDVYTRNMNIWNMNILSMGMSNDYEIAIEEGANMVRIGTSIFGNRQ